MAVPEVEVAMVTCNWLKRNKNRIIEYFFCFALVAIPNIILWSRVYFYKSPEEIKCNKGGYEFLHGKCWKEVK